MDKSIKPLSPDELYTKIQEKQAKRHKYLLIYRNKDEMTRALDGKIYAVSDVNETYLCDLLECDFIRLTDELKIVDNISVPFECYSDWIVADKIYRDEVLSQQLEITFTESEK